MLTYDSIGCISYTSIVILNALPPLLPIPLRTDLNQQHLLVHTSYSPKFHSSIVHQSALTSSPRKLLPDGQWSIDFVSVSEIILLDIIKYKQTYKQRWLIMNFRFGKPRQSKFKNSIGSQLQTNTSAPSFQSKLGVYRVKEVPIIGIPEKIKSHASFSVDKPDNATSPSPKKHALTEKCHEADSKSTYKFKLPQIHRILNLDNPENAPEDRLTRKPEQYYQKKVYLGLKHKSNSYLLNLARQHFLQSVEAIKIGKSIKLNPPKELKLPKRNPKFKTIFLDLDETLIHCDEASSNYTVKLNFPIEGGGGIIQGGIRVRPFCLEFIKELSAFAEIIIFTASAASYADVVLDYLDPHKRYFEHRLYRHHCTPEKGFFTKDLRIVNRRAQEVAIIDNSAFSFMVHPEFGIPILPFYHFGKDKQLLLLLQYLKKLVQVQDMREKIKADFFWGFYKKTDEDPRKVFINQFEKE